MFGIGYPELMIVGVVALLLFGSRLPEVARSLGKSLTEFKKGVQGVKDEFNDAVNSGADAARFDLDDHRDEPAPKFEPPTSPPREEEATSGSSAAN
ncbi:Sec-independent protein translocase subunit TatA/TatB [Aeoliella sp.]|uniref:Sec-independent protein translocase subunit TatA/TatB n=1 Tax=Aeoliella sp. TaxID=2795800 RepID=UPI003CCBC53D